MPYVDLSELKKEINDLKIQQKIDKKVAEEKIILGMDKIKRSFENGLKEKEQNSHFNIEDTYYNNFKNNTIDYQLNNRISLINSNVFLFNSSLKFWNKGTMELLAYNLKYSFKSSEILNVLKNL